MARWVQFGFVVLFALGFGVYLGIQRGRSLENLMKMGSQADVSGVVSDSRSLPAGRTHAGDTVKETVKTKENTVKLSQNSYADLEIREAKQSVLALVDENKKIRKEVLDLESQIRRLTHSLAEEKLENDRLRIKIGEIQDKRTAVPTPGPSIPEVCEVIDINEELNLVVLNRGSTDGIQHGMQLAVVRDGTVIAQLEAVNVRSRIAGAAIKFLNENETMIPGDRVIPGRN